VLRDKQKSQKAKPATSPFCFENADSFRSDHLALFSRALKKNPAEELLLSRIHAWEDTFDSKQLL
jgi:hypothetical protein